MASDKTSRQLYNNLYDRLMPGNARPGDFVDIGLNSRQRNEDHQGVVVPAYDLAAKDDDGKPARLSNRDINRMHRLMEAQASVTAGLRDMMRVQKIRMHHDICPGSYEVFVETFHDTLWTQDTDSECIWNATWKAPTQKAPPAFEPSAGTTVDVTGSLLHNAHEGSITFDPDASESAEAGTYRTRNLMDADTRYSPSYWSPNSFEGRTTAEVFSQVTFSSSSKDVLLTQGIVPVIFVHANDTFWATHWAGTLDTKVKALGSKNRITLYLYEDGAGDVDITKRLTFVPHLNLAQSFDETDDADSADNVFGKILNVEDHRYTPNSEVSYNTSTKYPYVSQWDDDAGAGEASYEKITLPTGVVGTLRNSTNAPAGMVNDDTIVTGTRVRVQADVTLAPGAKIYSWSLRLVRYGEFVKRFAGGMYA